MLLAKAKVTSTLIDIDVSGQKGRQWLFEVCKQGAAKDDGQEDEQEDDRHDESATAQDGGTSKLGIPREFSIQLDRYGRYYLIVRYKVKAPKEKAKMQFKGNDLLVRGGDPGVRTAQTWYSSDGTVTEFGSKKDCDRLASLRKKADCWKSKRLKKKESDGKDSKEDSGVDKEAGGDGEPSQGKAEQDMPFALSSAKRRQLLRKERRALKKHDNLVKDEHRRTASYLADTTDVLITPRMEVRGMVKRGSKINRSVKRSLLGWAHNKGLDVLALQVHNAGKVLLVQPEGYTSKTCANCGSLNQQLGSSKTFRCPSCTHTADRDHNAVVNMIIKAMR